MGASHNDRRHMGGVYGDIDIFLGDWPCTYIAIQRIRAQYLGVMRDHLQRDYYVWQQKIFIDHRNDNRANRTSLKSLWGTRYSRMCTSTNDHHMCARITKRNHGASLKSRWVGWKYFNRPLVQQIWSEPRGASATAHNPNTFEKYSSEILLRNTVSHCS